MENIYFVLACNPARRTHAGLAGMHCKDIWTPSWCSDFRFHCVHFFLPTFWEPKLFNFSIYTAIWELVFFFLWDNLYFVKVQFTVLCNVVPPRTRVLERWQPSTAVLHFLSSSRGLRTLGFSFIVYRTNVLVITFVNASINCSIFTAIKFKKKIWKL